MGKTTKGRGSYVAKLAEFALRTKLEDIPAEVLDLGRQRLADSVAVTFAGATEPAGRIAADLARSLRGDGPCVVVGAGFRTAADLAAFANAVSLHVLDWDDVSPTMFHPSAPVFPAVLALGEAQGASGSALFASYIVGVEVGLRMARALNPELFLRGFHPTGSVGSLAAVAAAAKLLDLQTEQTEMAFGLAMAQAAGMMANRGTMGKALHAGNVARAGVFAGMLAKQGFTGCREILSDRYGVFDAFLYGADGTGKAEEFALKTEADGGYSGEWKYDAAAITAEIGDRWELLRDWGIKPYPVGGSRQTLLEAAITLARQYDVDPGQIESVELLVNPFIISIDHTRPFSALDSRFSHPYCAAVALIDRKAGIEQFGPERFKDPKLHALLSRVKVAADPKLGNPAVEGFPTTVVVHLRNGKTHSVYVQKHKGQVGRPATWEDIREKYDTCSPLVLNASQAQELWDLIQELERQPTIERLSSILGGARVRDN